MDDLKAAWEKFLIDSDEACLLKVVEECNQIQPKNDNVTSESEDEELFHTHKICDIELCGKAFRVTRNADESESLFIKPCDYPAFNSPGVPYSLKGSALRRYIKDKQQKLMEECEHAEALLTTPPLPTCGSTIRFPRGNDNSSETNGEIIIDAASFESFLTNTDTDYEDKDELLSWVKNRDKSLMEETRLPQHWKNEYVANDMLRDGKASVWCTKCQEMYKISDLKEHDDALQQGWMSERLYCPQNHILLDIQALHISLTT